MSTGHMTVLGFPSTGKSSYIAAFWAQVEDDLVPDVTELPNSADLSYVQELARRVRSLEEPPRTRMDSQAGFDLPIRFAGGGDISLKIPDLSGEQLQSVVEDRHWPALLRDSLAAASGILLFVHPEQITLPLGLALVNTIVEVPAPDVEQGADAPAPDGLDPFANRDACTAAKLIDALELVLEETQDRWPVRVGVVVSAYDLVAPTEDGTRVPPGEWLRNRLPAVASFLEANSSRVNATVFAVSAQGGSVDSREALLAAGDHFERAWALDSEGTQIALSYPVRWATGWL